MLTDKERWFRVLVALDDLWCPECGPDEPLTLDDEIGLSATCCHCLAQYTRDQLLATSSYTQAYIEGPDSLFDEDPSPLFDLY